MSENPYNPYVDGGGYLDDGPVSGSRTSVLAVASLTTAIMCCVPFLGVLSIVMGASSMLLIGRSNGRLTGKTAAIGGMIVGIMSTVIWGAVGAGALQAQRFYITQMVPPAETAFSTVKSRDVSSFRATLTRSASDDVSDERIEAFMAAYEAEFGEYVEIATDWGTLFESFAETYSGSHNQSNNTVHLNNEIPIPMGVVGTNKTRVVWMLFDERSVKLKQPKIEDLLVMTSDSECFVLREDGPGIKLSHMMSLTVIPLDEVAGEAAGAAGATEGEPGA